LQASFPSFARLAGSQPEALGRALATSVRLLWLVSLPIAVVVCVAAEPLVVALAGPDYRDAALPMQLSSWIVPCLFVSIQFRFLFTALGQARVYIRLVLATLLLEGALIAALVPLAGYVGACVGALIGEIAFLAAGLSACRRLGIQAVEGRALVSAALAAAVLAAGLWWCRHLALPLLAAVSALATLGYFALCVVLGAIRRDEIRHLGGVLAVRLRSASTGPTGRELRGKVPNLE
jgi:O-antigen/teichoic acid export membrane protein